MDLQEELYDFIVVGTGITESILAGSLARVGRSVLHLDSNDFYGDQYATISLRDAIDWGSRNSAGAARIVSDARPPPPPPGTANHGTAISAVKKSQIAACLNAGEDAEQRSIEGQHPACGTRRMYRTGDSVAAMLDEDAVQVPFDPEVISPIYWGYKARAVPRRQHVLSVEVCHSWLLWLK